ncbi:MAG: FtsX-like permease family protein [Candidatus Cellulosilyticum pullistercoris]|uniref:FtsX-like permease family protein n=1 Tax=Candidatus Cellulosilyticum pullistercoris TaxID=2838521 RepID=A0A9E2KDL3_9FIRM|nr:FtsX-like permease family protein [Candidatus Cellulosilyticum pullistercoris]
MNIVNKLTLRQLKLNKKRTLVTIIGAIISVAMVMAVCTSMFSVLEFMKRMQIDSYGNWHAKYNNVEVKDLNVIKNHENTADTFLLQDIGYAKVDESIKSARPYLFVQGLNEGAYKHLNVELLEGRLPENNGEVVISKGMMHNEAFNYAIGDTISLTLGKRYGINEDTGMPVEKTDEYLTYDEDGKLAEIFMPEQEKTYTIVGVIEGPAGAWTWTPGYSSAYCIYTYIDETMLDSHEKVTVGVVAHKVGKQIYHETEEITSQLSQVSAKVNNELLIYYGVNADDGLVQALYGTVFIVMIIIMIGSISLIYNAFGISVSERAQYLGMLASVGATKKQKRNSVFFEGAIIGGISIPLGIMAGFLGIWVTFSLINPIFKNVFDIEEGLSIILKPSAVILTIIISALTIFISTYLPARRASRITPLEAIRQVQDIKLSKKTIKTSSLTRKIFGFEAELALKNMKRNKKRYRITIFSLVISIILFLTTSAFTSYLQSATEMSMNNANFDLQITSNKQGEEAYIALEKITNLEGVKESNLVTNVYVEANIPANWVPDSIKENVFGPTGLESYDYSTRLIIMKDELFEKYSEACGIKGKGTIPAILINSIRFYDKEAKKYVQQEMIDIKQGQEMLLNTYRWDEKIEESIKEELPAVTIAGVTTTTPLGVSIEEYGAQLQIVLSESSYINGFSKEQRELLGGYNELFLTTDEPLELEETIEKLNPVDTTDYYIYSIYGQKQIQDQMIMLMKVFIYGFIVLITAICVANIFNTISTSIGLRKREFAMLQSVGMTPKSFNKMINFESMFYGIKALVYGFPISLLIMVILYNNLSRSFKFTFFVPIKSIMIVIVGVFILVGSAMYYSGGKVKKQNIIEGLKDSNM